MKNELNNDQGNSPKPANGIQANSCAKCNKNPCICSGDDKDSCQETPDQKTASKDNHQKTKRPKTEISYI